MSSLNVEKKRLCKWYLGNAVSSPIPALQRDTPALQDKWDEAGTYSDLPPPTIPRFSVSKCSFEYF